MDSVFQLFFEAFVNQKFAREIPSITSIVFFLFLHLPVFSLVEVIDDFFELIFLPWFFLL